MKKRPKDLQTIQTLKEWLQQGDNNKVKLAALLGYESSDAIRGWISRGRVAEREKSKVINIISKGKNKSGDARKSYKRAG